MKAAKVEMRYPMLNRAERTLHPRGGASQKTTPVACPECGGLQCLCRPRWASGDALTAEALNQLVLYIKESNRMHNRYLHDWGTVYGLEVVCHPCMDSVIVRPGYAISQCGDDIRVCNDAEVQICDMVRKCKDKERQDRDCGPYSYLAANPQDCKDQCQDWVLYIRYDEKPARQTPALRASPGQSRCSNCGNSRQSCGCQGSQGNGTKARSSTAKAAWQPQVRCEPMMICEGFQFELERYTPPPPARPGGYLIDPYFGGGTYDLFGLTGIFGYAGLAAQFYEPECWDELIGKLPSSPANNSPEARQKWCCDLQESLKAFFLNHPTYDCQLDEKLRKVTCPSVQDAEFDRKLQDAILQMAEIALSYLTYCMCSRFFTPDFAQSDDPRVPLAVITICSDGCSVIDICNFDVRRYASTRARPFPTEMAGLCCQPEAEPLTISGFRPRAAERYTNLRSAARAFPRQDEFSSVAFRVWANPAERFSARRLLLGALGALDENGKPLVPDEALRSPAQFWLAGNVIAPQLDALIPREIAETLRPLSTRASRRRAAAPPLDQEVSRMRREMDEMRQKMADQQTRIEEMTSRLDKPRGRRRS
jgi:hypothetical protein